MLKTERIAPFKKTLFYLCSLILSATFSFALCAQETVDSVAVNTNVMVAEPAGPTDTASHYYRFNGRYLKSYWTDLKAVVARPAHWKGKDWRNFGILAGTTGLLMATADKPLKRMMLRNQKEVFTSTGKVFEPLGNQITPLLVAGMYVSSVVMRNRRMEHASLNIAKSVVISTVIYTATKKVIRRQRPVRTDNQYQFAAPFTQKGFTSMPSGHANTVFSAATALALEYKDRKWVAWTAYSIATLTAVTRMYQNRHWSSDILVGASIGHFVTKAIYKLEEKRKNTLLPAQ